MKFISAANEQVTIDNSTIVDIRETGYWTKGASIFHIENGITVVRHTQNTLQELLAQYEGPILQYQDLYELKCTNIYTGNISIYVGTYDECIDITTFGDPQCTYKLSKYKETHC